MKDEQEHLKEMLETLNECCWIGEDGGMACTSSTKRGALIKFRRLIRQDNGELEAMEIDLNDISVGWARLATEKELEETWSEFFVMYKKKSPYKCWVLRT